MNINQTELPRLGVSICTFNSGDVILDCLESLLQSTGVALSIVVADNASTDNTVALIRSWAADRSDYHVPEDHPLPPTGATTKSPIDLDGAPIDASPHRIFLIETGANGGFAAGVNAGLAVLAKDTALDRFWVLNPDCIVLPETGAAFATEPTTRFSLMGGRVLYCDGTQRIQIDGGTINRHTGVTGNLNLGAPHNTTPQPIASQMDFITGANLVVSRQFYDMAGPMPEDYFLYYEEVDWAMRRGDLPLVYCNGGTVYHRAGTAIGSPTLGRPASPFSLYFKHRARIRFMRRYFPMHLPGALLYSLAKAGQLFLKGYSSEAATILAASLGRPPAAGVRDKLSAVALARILAG